MCVIQPSWNTCFTQIGKLPRYCHSSEDYHPSPGGPRLPTKHLMCPVHVLPQLNHVGIVLLGRHGVANWCNHDVWWQKLLEQSTAFLPCKFWRISYTYNRSIAKNISRWILKSITRKKTESNARENDVVKETIIYSNRKWGQQICFADSLSQIPLQVATSHASFTNCPGPTFDWQSIHLKELQNRLRLVVEQCHPFL